MSIKLSGGTHKTLNNKKVTTIKIEHPGTLGVKPGDSVTIYQFVLKYDDGEYYDGEMYYVYGEEIKIVKQPNFSYEIKHKLNELKKKNDATNAEYAKKVGPKFPYPSVLLKSRGY
jgi:hypothetical protein